MSEVRTGYSYIEYEGDGVTDTYSVNFVLGYLRPAFVTCQVNNEEDGTGNPMYRTLTFLPGDTGMVQIGGAVPGVGESIVFRRVIPKDLLMHMYSNGSILDYPSLDESHLQLMMALQEVLDGFGLANIYTDIDMHGFKIVGVLSDSTMPDSVVTFAELQKFSADVQVLTVLGASEGASFVGYGSTTVEEHLDALAASNGSSLVGFVQAGAGADARTVQDKLRDVVSVKDFGAAGDGVTDDTAAIQDALTYATEGGLTLVFPAGVYSCDAPITWTYSGAGALEIRCDPGAVLRPSAIFPTGLPFIRPLVSGGNGKFSFTWRGGVLDGRNMPGRIVNTAPDIMYVTSSDGSFSYLTIENVTFIQNDTRYGISGDSCLFTVSNNVKISGCSFKGAIDAAIYVSADATGTLGENCIITNNTFDECNVAFITKRDFLYHIVSDNIITDCNYGITIGGAASGLGTGKYGVISGNIIRNVSFGISARESDGTIITGNRVENYGLRRRGTRVEFYEIGEPGYVEDPINSAEPLVGEPGIKIEGSSNCVVSNNLVIMTDFSPLESSSGIRIFPNGASQSINNLVQGNVIVAAGLGLEEGSNVDYNLFLDNSTINCTRRRGPLAPKSFIRDHEAGLDRITMAWGETTSSILPVANMVYKRDGSIYEQYLTNDDSEVSFILGDNTNSTVARMTYTHIADRWSFRAGGSGEVFRIDPSGPQFGTNTGTSDVPITGYISIKTLDGVTRKLAVIG